MDSDPLLNAGIEILLLSGLTHGIQLRWTRKANSEARLVDRDVISRRTRHAPGATVQMSPLLASHLFQSISPVVLSLLTARLLRLQTLASTMEWDDSSSPDNCLSLTSSPRVGLSCLMCHNSLVIKRTGFVDSKYSVLGAKGDVLFTLMKQGKVSGRGRQLLLLDANDGLRPLLMLQISECSPLYALGIGSAQMLMHELPGGRLLGRVAMVPGGFRKGQYQILDHADVPVVMFKRKDKLLSFRYKFKNASGVPIGSISSLDSWSSSRVRLDMHPGLDQRIRTMLVAAAFLVTKVEVQSATI